MKTIAAICLPESYLDFIQDMNRIMKEQGIEAHHTAIEYENSISKVLRNGKSIEADLRMIHNDRHLDIRPLITIIAEPATYNGKAVSTYVDISIKFEYDPNTKKQKLSAPIITGHQHIVNDRVYDPATIEVAPKFKGDTE